jgi:hypothetical protein
MVWLVSDSAKKLSGPRGAALDSVRTKSAGLSGHRFRGANLEENKPSPPRCSITRPGGQDS